MAQAAPAENENGTIQFPGTGSGEVIDNARQMEVSAAVLEYPDLPRAVKIVIGDQKASASHLQQILAIGYNKAARLLEQMEELGYVTSPNHIGRRDVVLDTVPSEFENVARAAQIAKAGGKKNTAEDVAVADRAYRVTAAELRQFVERTERLEAEKKDVADQLKEVMAEAKGRGYDTKVLRKVIALRKRDKDDIAEEEAILEMYKEALGM